MIGAVIRWSVDNRLLVLILAAVLAGWGLWALRATPLDAIPDLSDVQVIVYTNYVGQAPQVVEDQVTYPLTTALLAVPGATAVRGYSFFGDSYVYVLFEEGTDIYWARSRVLEYLNQVRLPPGAEARLGPDASGVGWVYQYALVDRSGEHDLAQLRSLQDWFLRFELQAVRGVSEVATLGGMVRQYQVVLDPNRLRAYDLTLAAVRDALTRASLESGGALIEQAEAEYMVRGRGYLTGLEDLRAVPVGLGPDGTPIMLENVAELRIGPQIRRGLAELDGEGEVVGGFVVMRHGENALAVIERVKQRIDELRPSLPQGVEIVETYDRSHLIRGTVENLTHKLILEFIIVALVCALFLFHLRSSLVIVLTLPLGVLAAFIVMQLQGINANVMSLGGIAIAIGAMVDGAIVMIENAHKHLERAGPGADRIAAIREAAVEVGRPIFFALLVITLSFLPVFTLEGQEGRLFSPLAFTKTYAMAAAAGLAVTLVPALMVYLVRGRIVPEQRNPLNRALIFMYRPGIEAVLRHPRLTLLLVLLLAASLLWPAARLGTEFMPEMDEGDLMYMPTLDPGVSIGKVQQFLQQSDRLIMQLPEVRQVFGKAGRAETATDPAPLGMLETTVRFHPRDQWRPGVTLDDLIAELDALLDFPGVSNVWVMPIRTRIDMLATGIRSPVGIKVSGPDLAQAQAVAESVEAVLREVPGTASAFAERPAHGRYIDIDVDRRAAARYGLSMGEVQDVVRYAIGGANVAETIEGLERYPVNLRYPQAWRDSVEALRVLPVVTPSGAHVPLGELAAIDIVAGPTMIRSENARPNVWGFVDIRGADLGAYVRDAQQAVRDAVDLPAGYSLSWSGQYEYLERARERLNYVVPLTVVVIFLLLYFAFGNLIEPLMVMASLPLALVGGFWLLYFMEFQMSVAVAVGFIALAGVAAEFGVVMLVYLQEAYRRHAPRDRAALRAAVVEGAVLRVRPKAMTALTIILGLIPVLYGTGPGSEVMQRIAAPMVGGMVTAPLVSMLLIPVLYYLWKRNTLPEPEPEMERHGAPEDRKTTRA